MTNHRKLRDALKHVAPEEAGALERAGREARDARRMDDPDVEEVLLARMAARLHRDERKDPNRALTKAQKAAQRAAKRTAQELTPDDSPSAEEVAKFAAYHEERTAQLEAPALNAEGDDEWDVKAESLARRARNAALQEAARATEDEAKANWRARVGSRQESGLGWNEHRRAEAFADEPMEPDVAVDAEELATFKEMVKVSAAPWLAPEDIFNPLAGHVSPRTARKDARAASKANGGDVVPSLDGGEEVASTVAEKVGREPRSKRDKAPVKPSIARNGCGGNQR